MSYKISVLFACTMFESVWHSVQLCFGRRQRFGIIAERTLSAHERRPAAFRNIGAYLLTKRHRELLRLITSTT